jgi:hypothetical protein
VLHVKRYSVESTNEGKHQDKTVTIIRIAKGLYDTNPDQLNNILYPPPPPPPPPPICNSGIAKIDKPNLKSQIS